MSPAPASMRLNVKKWRDTHVLFHQTQYGHESGPGAGDCIRASMATLLQINPTRLRNWMELETEDWQAEMDADLAALGYTCTAFEFEDSQEFMGKLNAPGPVLLAGTTEGGHGHCMVGLFDGTLIHDPRKGCNGCPTIEQVWLVTKSGDVSWDEDNYVHIALDALDKFAK